MQVMLGILYHCLGGTASGSFYLPFNKVKGWAWESYWMIGGLFSWLIVPPLAEWITVPGFAEIIAVSFWILHMSMIILTANCGAYTADNGKDQVGNHIRHNGDLAVSIPGWIG